MQHCLTRPRAFSRGSAFAFDAQIFVFSRQKARSFGAPARRAIERSRSPHSQTARWHGQRQKAGRHRRARARQNRWRCAARRAHHARSGRRRFAGHRRFGRARTYRPKTRYRGPNRARGARQIYPATGKTVGPESRSRRFRDRFVGARYSFTMSSSGAIRRCRPALCCAPAA